MVVVIRIVAVFVVLVLETYLFRNYWISKDSFKPGFFLIIWPYNSYLCIAA